MTQFSNIRMKEAEKRQQLQISRVCSHCTCNTRMNITKESIREDYVWRCYWCGKVNEPTQIDKGGE